MLRKLLWLIVISGAAISCQKEFTIEDIDPPVGPNDDSTLLAVYAELDTSFAATMDTINAYYFFYDSQKRISKAHTRYKDPGGSVYEEARGDFFYQGADTLPFKITEFFTDDDNYSSFATTYYFYNNTGKLIKDSTISYNMYPDPADNYQSFSVSTYRYLGNMTEHTFDYFDFDPVNPSNYTTVDSVYRTSINDNVVLQVDTSYDASVSQASITKIMLSYDEKVNPFRRFSYLNYYMDYNLDIINVTQKNNPLIVNGTLESASTTNTIDSRYVYMYNSDNYPVSFLNYSKINGAAEAFGFKGVYSYTR